MQRSSFECDMGKNSTRPLLIGHVLHSPISHEKRTSLYFLTQSNHAGNNCDMGWHRHCTWGRIVKRMLSVELKWHTSEQVQWPGGKMLSLKIGLQILYQTIKTCTSTFLSVFFLWGREGLGGGVCSTFCHLSSIYNFLLKTLSWKKIRLNIGITILRYTFPN